MKTIALRFGEHFSPKAGTISAHEEILTEYGFVWFGKMGSVISKKVVREIFNSDTPRILLIRSGKIERYWAYVSEIQYDVPPKEYIPSYYRDDAENFHTWIKISKFELAPRNILSKYCVASSGTPLNIASTHSMSPYFIIEERILVTEE